LQAAQICAFAFAGARAAAQPNVPAPQGDSATTLISDWHGEVARVFPCPYTGQPGGADKGRREVAGSGSTEEKKKKSAPADFDRKRNTTPPPTDAWGAERKDSAGGSQTLPVNVEEEEGKKEKERRKERRRKQAHRGEFAPMVIPCLRCRRKPIAERV